VVLAEGDLVEAVPEDHGKEVKMFKIQKKIKEKSLLCPRCNINMKKIAKRDVIIDVCKKCGGMWADAGELEKLAKINREDKE